MFNLSESTALIKIITGNTAMNALVQALLWTHNPLCLFSNSVVTLAHTLLVKKAMRPCQFS